jgi:hypothetical protein
MTQALIRRDDRSLSITFTETALQMKEMALARSALIGLVNSPATQEAAVRAQQEIANALGQVEKARTACKAPIIDFGRKIDEAARTFVEDLKYEQVRLATMVGDFQKLEEQRVRAAQQAENERLSKLERERAEALRTAESHDQVDKIQEHFNERAKVEAPQQPIAPARAEGQRVQDDWEVTVSDVHLLYRAHPTCVKVEPLIGEIKSLLKAGVDVKGVVAKRIKKAGVTRARLPEAINV